MIDSELMVTLMLMLMLADHGHGSRRSDACRSRGCAAGATSCIGSSSGPKAATGSGQAQRWQRQRQHRRMVVTESWRGQCRGHADGGGRWERPRHAHRSAYTGRAAAGKLHAQASGSHAGRCRRERRSCAAPHCTPGNRCRKECVRQASPCPSPSSGLRRWSSLRCRARDWRRCRETSMATVGTTASARRSSQASRRGQRRRHQARSLA